MVETGIEELVRVHRTGICIGDTTIPLRFFAYGQPGWRFATFPETYGRKTHIRIDDLTTVRELYERHAAKRKRPCSKRTARPPARATEPRLVPPDSPPTEDDTTCPQTREELHQEAARELARANRLALQLANLKSRIAGLERVTNTNVDELQRQHAVHLNRYLALRQRIEAVP